MTPLEEVRDRLRAMQRELEDAGLADLPHTRRLHRCVTAAVHEATDALLLGPSALPPAPLPCPPTSAVAPATTH